MSTYNVALHRLAAAPRATPCLAWTSRARATGHAGCCSGGRSQDLTRNARTGGVSGRHLTVRWSQQFPCTTGSWRANLNRSGQATMDARLYFELTDAITAALTPMA